eukprot:SAG31_NODE_359_length_17032_cov_11.017894_10_plen_173_part_00
MLGGGGSGGNPGGWGHGAPGGGGGWAEGTITVLPGDEFLVIAGERGFGTGTPHIQYNWGGGATGYNTGQFNYVGGGGGASGVWKLTGTAQLREPRPQHDQGAYSAQFTPDATVLMAGGGGGGGASRAGEGNVGGGGGGREGEDGSAPYDGQHERRGELGGSRMFWKRRALVQ